MQTLSKFATFVKETIAETFPNGVTNQREDEEAKAYINSVDTRLNTYKKERLEITRQFDEVKKELMKPEKELGEISKEIATLRNVFANKVAQALEVTNYRQQFETRLTATLKSLAIDHAQTGKPAKAVDLSKVMPMPYQSHLKEVHVTLATEWQPKASRLYLTYYNEAPKGAEAVEAKQMVQAVALLEIASLEAEKLDYKPKGSIKAVEVVTTHPTALKYLFELYFKANLGAVLEDKNLTFVNKWAAKLGEAQLAELSKIEGVQVVSSIKTTKR